MINNMANKKSMRVTYTTCDKALVAAMLSNGHDLTLVSKDQNGDIHYSFQHSNGIERLALAYDEDRLMVNMDYADVLEVVNNTSHGW